jgi:hypothetical protein
MCCVVPFTVSKSKSSHEDVGRDQGKFVSGGCRGEDPCSFLHRLRAERAELFAEGLALGAIFDGRRPRHTRTRASLHRMGSVSGDRVGSICGDRMGRFCGDRMGSVSGDRMGRFCGNRTGSISGDRMGSVSGDRVGRLICYTETRSTR